MLSRFAQRAPLALPLLAAHAPACLCGGALSRAARLLHVVARRRSGDHAKVVVHDGADAGDLKSAVIAALRLDVAPDCVRLLREVRGGGAPVPLDSSRLLARQGIREGAKVLVEVLAAPAPPPLPPPPPPPPLPLHALSGLIVRAPDAALDAGLLAALAGADTPDAQRLGALSALVTDHLTRHPAFADEAPSLPLFHTVAHAALLRELVTRARALAAGGYKGSNGGPCRTLVGARGIGKTAVLRAFALVAPSAFPSLLPVYLTGQGLMQREHVLQAGHLQAVLSAAAAQQRLPLDRLTKLPAGRRLLLLMDEFDDLYRAPASAPALVHNVLTTLWELHALGNRIDGNSSVLLCGSSSSTYSLVQGDGARMGGRFPLALGGVPDLNSTKFRRLRLAASLCTASAEVEAMLAAVGGGGRLGCAQSTAAARLLTFFVGATPRAVIGAVLPGGVQGLTGALLAASSPATPPDVVFEHPETGAFLRALLVLLAERNSKLRDLTRKSDGTANFLAMMDPACNWEQAVVPLAWREVEMVFKETAVAAATPPDPSLLMSMLDEIADRHLLRVHFPGSLDTSAQVWPASAAQAVAGGLPRDADLAGAAVAISQTIGKLALLARAVAPLL